MFRRAPPSVGDEEVSVTEDVAQPSADDYVSCSEKFIPVGAVEDIPGEQYTPSAPSAGAERLPGIWRVFSRLAVNDIGDVIERRELDAVKTAYRRAVRENPGYRIELKLDGHTNDENEFDLPESRGAAHGTKQDLIGIPARTMFPEGFGSRYLLTRGEPCQRVQYNERVVATLWRVKLDEPSLQTSPEQEVEGGSAASDEAPQPDLESVATEEPPTEADPSNGATVPLQDETSEGD